MQCVAAMLLRPAVTAWPVNDTPTGVAFMAAWVISGAGFGLLGKDEILGFFLGGAAAITLLLNFMCVVIDPRISLIVVPVSIVLAACLVGFLRQEARIEEARSRDLHGY